MLTAERSPCSGASVALCLPPPMTCVGNAPACSRTVVLRWKTPRGTNTLQPAEEDEGVAASSMARCSAAPSLSVELTHCVRRRAVIAHNIENTSAADAIADAIAADAAAVAIATPDRHELSLPRV